MNVKNIQDGNFDFIPSKLGLVEEDRQPREIPQATWFVAEVKEGLENKYEAKRYLERKVGRVANENVKKEIPDYWMLSWSFGCLF